MKIKKLTLSSGAFLALALTTGSLTAQEGSPIEGTWTWTAEGFGGQEVSSSLTLKQAEDALTGTLHGAFGPAEIEEAKLEDGKLSFKVTRSFGDRSFTTDYAGEVKGDKIEGTIETTRGNEDQEADWLAYRAPEIDPTGTWKWSTPSGRDGGQERDAWVKLSYGRGELKGLYKTEQGQAEIKDAKLDGKTISFKVERGMGDRVFTTAFKGTLSDGKIEGTIESTRGDNTREREWVATPDYSKVDAEGVWTWETRGRGGDTNDDVLTLKKEGDALTGTYEGRDSETKIEDAKVTGDKLTFSMSRETERGDFTSTFNGRIDGDKIVGDITTNAGEWTSKRSWVAERDTPEANAEGEWTWSTRRGRDGEERTSTLALAKTEGSLGGTLTSGDNETELKDVKLDGNVLIFNVEREFRDTTATMKYRGVIKGDSIEGTWQAENDESGWMRNWEAKRSGE